MWCARVLFWWVRRWWKLAKRNNYKVCSWKQLQLTAGQKKMIKTTTMKVVCNLCQLQKCIVFPGICKCAHKEMCSNRNALTLEFGRRSENVDRRSFMRTSVWFICQLREWLFAFLMAKKLSSAAFVTWTISIILNCLILYLIELLWSHCFNNATKEIVW